MDSGVNWKSLEVGTSRARLFRHADIICLPYRVAQPGGSATPENQKAPFYGHSLSKQFKYLPLFTARQAVERLDQPNENVV